MQLVVLELGRVSVITAALRPITAELTKTSFTRYNRLSTRSYNRFDNRVYRVKKHPTGYQTGCQIGLTTSLTTGCIV